MAHSTIVGGSTADRVINCPGSVKLCDQMPPKPSSKYADEGTLLHGAIERMMMGAKTTELLGMTYEDQTLTEELVDELLLPAFKALDTVDPNGEMEFECEVQVGFDDILPGVFGTTDVLGRIGNTAIILDWKFGRGVPVTAEENSQLMFYAAGAMRTKHAEWAFKNVNDVELIIVQPAHGVSRWRTTLDRIRQFEASLILAVTLAQKNDAPVKAGAHCQWCQAKPICPVMTRAVDRALKTKIEGLPVDHINNYLKNADLLEQWIIDIRALAHQMMEADTKFADWKLVAKRATRKWADEGKAKAALLAAGCKESDITETSLLSPAQVEKRKIALPEGHVVAVSSGSTLARRDDPRPEVLQIGKQLTEALGRIVNS